MPSASQIKTKYPGIRVSLKVNGSYEGCVSRVRMALKRAGVGQGDIDLFTWRCREGDMNDVVDLCKTMVTCEDA